MHLHTNKRKINTQNNFIQKNMVNSVLFQDKSFKYFKIKSSLAFAKLNNHIMFRYE